MSTQETASTHLHPLHSPNLPQDQLEAYLKSKAPKVHPNSLIEKSLHNEELVKYFASRIDMSLVRELVQAAERVIRIHDSPATTSTLPTPPVTPVKGTFKQQQERQKHSSTLPRMSPYTHPSWRPLEQFVIKLIEKSRVHIMTLAHTLIVLDRVRDRLPPMAQGMPCTRHRVFLAALIVASKYLNDATPKNRHWAEWARVFDCTEISLMEKQMLAILDWDLRITEDEVFERLQSLIQPKERRSKARQEAVKKVQENAAARQQHYQPHTPITPSNANTNLEVASSAPPAVVAAREEARVEVAKKSFNLQPVPAAAKKRAAPTQRCVSGGARVEGNPLPMSQSEPCGVHTGRPPHARSQAVDSNEPAQRPYLALPSFPSGMSPSHHNQNVPSSVMMPRARSYSSDGAYRQSFASTKIRPTLSSTTSSSMVGSSTLSTSSSSAAGSEVNTPSDRIAAWISGEAYYTGRHEYTQHGGARTGYHYVRNRHNDQSQAYSSNMGNDISSSSSDFMQNVPSFVPGDAGRKMYGNVEDGTNQSGFLTKLLGVGRSASPTRRIGHRVRGGERKVSTATTIVPEDIQIDH